MNAPAPLTQLYGCDGLLRLTPRSLGKSQKLREVGWNNRFTAERSESQSQQRLRKVKSDGSEKSTIDMQPEKLIPKKSSSPMNAGYSSKSFDFDKQLRREKLHEVKSSSRKQSYRRCVDKHTTDEEIVMRGLYKLNSAEERVYDLFVEMLSGFDHSDVMSIVEDAILDSQMHTQLHAYGGFENVNNVAAQEIGES